MSSSAETEDAEGQSTNETTWVASDVTVVTLTRIKARVVMLSACIGPLGGALSLTGRLFRAFQAASNDRP